MKAKQYIQKAFVVTLTSVMLAGTVAPASPVEAAAKKAIVVSNDRTVLVAGRNYYVKNENAANFKSSNESVASIDQTGKITPKKTGYVTISAKVDGETVKSKFMCVSKYGVTSSQTKVDKMLDAENVNKISIVTSKANDYEIAEGSYDKKVLTVKAPNADVDNSGTFKEIKIKDVAANTFRNRAKNKIIITDKDFRLAEKATGSDITVAADAAGKIIPQGKDTNITTSGKLEIQASKVGTMDLVTVKGGELTLNLKALPKEIKEVVITEKADVNVIGGTKANVAITVEETAAGTTIDSSCSVNVTVEAQAHINLTDAAGGSTITVAEGVKAEVKVDAAADGKVTVGTTEVEAGNTATVETDGTVDVTTDDSASGDTSADGGVSGGGSSSSGGSSSGTTTEEVTVTAVYDETNNKTTYTFGSNIADLKTFTVNITGTYAGTVAITNVTKLLELQKTAGSKLTDIETRVANWANITNASYDCGADSMITVTGEKGSAIKTVEGPGYTAQVGLYKDDAGELAAEIVIGNAQKLLVVTSSEESFRVGKVIETDETTECTDMCNVTIGTDTITVSGKDTTKILSFSNITK